jgi:hypothetical protein
MNVTAALNTALHYVHTNPRTVAIVIGSPVVMNCLAVLSVTAFNAAGLTAGGLVASDPPSSHFHLNDSKSDQWPGGALALLQPTVGGTPIFAAVMQSAAMGGYGVAIVNGVVQTGGAIAGLATVAHVVR